MYTAFDQVLNFLRRDLCPLPRVRPFGPRRGWIWGSGRLRLFLCHWGVFTTKDPRKERHVGNATVEN